MDLPQNTEFPWPFRDGGIFGLPGEAHLELAPNEPVDQYMDDYSNVQDDGSFHGLEFVSTPILSFQDWSLHNKTLKSYSQIQTILHF
jgi:hypothetical protein